MGMNTCVGYNGRYLKFDQAKFNDMSLLSRDSAFNVAA